MVDIFRESEISQLELPLRVHEDVGWLQISMNYALIDQLAEA